MLVAIQSNDNRKSNSGFGSSNGHNEEHENLPRCISNILRKSNERKINRVEHKFNTHKHYDCVTLSENTNNSYCKKNCTKNEIMLKWNQSDLQVTIKIYD